LNKCNPELVSSGGIFDLPAKQEEVLVLEKQSTEPNFWDNNDTAQATLRRIRILQQWIDSWNEVNQGCIDLDEMYALAKEEKDEDLQKSILDDAALLEEKLQALELRKMLNGEYDSKQAILTINSGAGGTESQDWAEMLFRMYQRFFDAEQMDAKVLDVLEGEEAGIKSATFEVRSEYSFGYLRSEIGVHRLVRISPFDSNARRHTSFAAVYVYPVLDDVEVDFSETDLRVDTFRASGAGGQHINKTDSAVRITHVPTGLVASCQTERSQLQNRETALKILKAMVAQKMIEEEEERRSEKMAKKQKIEWGSQIRNYVLHPYNLVKDLRTNVETSDTAGVLNGDIKPFIQAYLLSGQEQPELSGQAGQQTAASG
jgi:peptide chain release factor 2